MENDTLEALRKANGNKTQAARILGIARSSLRDRIENLQKKGIIIPLPELITEKVSILTSHGQETAKWDKKRLPRMDREDGEYLPDPKFINKIATYTDGQNQIIGQWVSENIDHKKQFEKLFLAVEALKETIEPIKLIQAPEAERGDLVLEIPIGDLHLGMLAWAAETGTDYSLNIAENILTGGIKYLMSQGSGCKKCVLVVLGDFFHYDSLTPETPTSKHVVDADNRFPKMIKTGFRVLRRIIEHALENFEEVEFIMTPGNHDPVSCVFMPEALANLYENNPQIYIQTSPMNVHYYRFGNNLIGITHGDKIKMENLPHVMANDRPKDWGETNHRYWRTGHIHKEKVLTFPGCKVESFEVLAGWEAYIQKMGFRPIRSLQGIVLHRKYGEQIRYTFTPEMFDDMEPNRREAAE
jgi:hypothetical protein